VARVPSSAAATSGSSGVEPSSRNASWVAISYDVSVVSGYVPLASAVSVAGPSSVRYTNEGEISAAWIIRLIPVA
jgi:hypothetical protein